MYYIFVAKYFTMYKFLTIPLLLVSLSAGAKGLADTVDLPSPVAKATLSMMPRYGGNRGGGGVHFYYGIELGYAAATTKTAATALTAATSSKGGGFMYNGDIGIKIVLPGRNDNRAGYLSISLCGMVSDINTKYKDASGNSQTDRRTLSVLSLPLSYTSMGFGSGGEGAGFYWQVGLNPDYMFTVKDGDNKITDHYNKFYFEPFAGFGVSIPFVMRNRATHSDVGGGRVLVGPYFSYDATNMAKDSGVNMNGYTIGLRWTYVFI